MKSDPSPATDCIVLQNFNSEVTINPDDKVASPSPAAGNHTTNNHTKDHEPTKAKQNGHASGQSPSSESATKSNAKTRKVISRREPPDGGFGWVVVFASFMCNVIVDGIIFSFGFLLPEISAEFNENKATTAWIGSLQTGFYLIVGPLVSALAEKYDCRKITIIGSVVTAIGFILSYFAQNVLTLYVTFGLLGGIGFGFVFLPAIVTVGYYFEKKRAFATGIAVCGSGVGTFVLPPIIQYIIKQFGWRICILILSGITLFCALFGSFFKPLTKVIEVPDEEANQTQPEKPLLMRIKEARARDWTQSEENLQPGATTEEITVNGNQNGVLPPVSDVLNIIPLNDTSETPKTSVSRSGSVASKSNIDTSLNRTRTRSERRATLTPRDEMMYSNLSLVVLPQSRSISNLNQAESNRDGRNSVSGGATATVTIIEKPRGFLSGFNLSLLKRPSFVLLAISGFLCLVGFFIPFIYISDRAKLLGCSPEKCAFILSVIGITNTIGRVCCGWASDNRVNALLLNNLALTIGGVATIISPIVFNSYATLIVYASIFGFSVATFATLRSVITVELLGLEKLTSAFGLLLLFQGLAVTIGSPIAGWFFDITGSYDYSFYLSGSAIALSGVMCYPLNAIARWEKKLFKESEDVQA